MICCVVGQLAITKTMSLAEDDTPVYRTILPPVAVGGLDAPEAGTVQCGTALLPEGAIIAITITATVGAGYASPAHRSSAPPTARRSLVRWAESTPGTTAKVSLEVSFLIDAQYCGTSVTNAAKAEATTLDSDLTDNTSSVTVTVTPRQPARQTPPPQKPGNELPNTGSSVSPGLLFAALALIVAGLGVLAATRSRRTRI